MGRAANKKRGIIGSAKTNNNAKGKLVERIVSMLHNDPNVQVERNVKVAGRGSTKRNREIDVLVTAGLLGYTVQIAFECKNEAKPIGVDYIDAFRGKLDYIGIPIKQGKFVSASGYTADAIICARDAGIEVFTLHGLTKDRLASVVIEAFQHIIYLLPEVLELEVTSNIGETHTMREQGEMLSFHDEQGKICGAMPDLLWNKWIRGDLPASLGEHELVLDIPKHWHYVIGGKEQQLLAVRSKVAVVGVVVSKSGTATTHALVNADGGKLFKQHVSAEFELVDGEETLPVTIMRTEDELNDFINKQQNVNITVGRFRLPRILIGPMYYPPSERTARITIGLGKAFEEGKIPDPRPFTREELEGTDLSTVFEPIWSAHPAVKKNDWINWIQPNNDLI